MANLAGELGEGGALSVGGDDDRKQHGVWGEQTFLRITEDKDLCHSSNRGSQSA